MLPPYVYLILNILVNFAVFLIVTLSLNLETGYAGIPQFGRVLAVLAGAIVAGAVPGRLIAYYIGEKWGAEYANHLYNFPIVDRINREILAPNPLLSIGILLFTLVVAAIFGGILGYLSSYPALRLKEAYLGITLLAFGDALQIIGKYWQPLVGATMGVTVPDPYRCIGIGAEKTIGATLIFLGFAILIYLFVESLGRSPFGRALKAMRDSEVAAEVYGKNIVRLRGWALIIGGAIAAVGGALWAFYAGSMKALTYDRLTWTFWPWAFMMLGGTGNNFGVFVGVLIFSTVRSLIYVYKHALATIIPIKPAWLEYILVGLVIVLISLFRPQGFIPEKPALSVKRKEIERIKEAITSKKAEA
ncbi:branched-chain amino acid ABC transporter permease [Candidatus Geothermarchaeota archaeon]|nr:MAG: branched-chain amino acid ABC transporter permease [Candidatus Geothermarchaeota archaeon]HEW94201.1 branched-chain amino acid ABC transporter permease [Thermoprotei archaeon]